MVGEKRGLLNPKSVAVVGASNTKGKVGYAVLKNLVSSKFKGKIFPVNPSHKNIFGLKCYPSLSDIKGDLDSVVVIVPPSLVKNVVEDAGRKKANYVTVITSGFGEVGNKLEEEEILRIANNYGIRVIGPNCFGMINTEIGLNTTFSDAKPLKGDVAFVSQSGALCASMLDWSSEHNFGFSKFVSVGNQIDVSETDVLEQLGDDDSTRIILMYIESIKNPRNFLEVASKVTKKKPIIVFKSGVTEGGSKAALSHTGSISGDDSLYDSLFEKSNVIRVHEIDNLFNLSHIFSIEKIPHKKGVAVITNSGGPGVITADSVNKEGLHLVSFNDSTKKDLIKNLSNKVVVSNPLDLLGDTTVDSFEKAISIVCKDKDVDTVVVLVTPLSTIDVTLLAKKFLSLHKKTDKFLTFGFMGGKKVENGRKMLESHNLLVSHSPSKTIHLLSKAIRYNEANKRKEQVHERVWYDKGLAEKVINEAVKNEQKTFSYSQGKDFLKSYGIFCPVSFLVRNKKDAVNSANKIGFPVVLKIDCPEIQHKTEKGLIFSNLNNEKDVADAYDKIMLNFEKVKQGKVMFGVDVVKQVSGYELVVGVNKDSSFGHVLTVGFGGVFVELYKDVAQTMFPVSKQEILDLIRKTKFYKVLEGFRNMEKVDVQKVVDTAYKVCALAKDYDLDVVEVNPFMINSKDCFGVDLIITVPKKK